MKAMILVASPEECVNLLNGDLSVLIRKCFSKDYVGWVYIYCTKEKKLLFDNEQKIYFVGTHNASLERHSADTDIYMNTAYEKSCDNLTGKVVARFWCDKVEYVENTYDEFRWGEEDYSTETLNPDVLYEKSCLSFEKMDRYLKGDCGYAIHITKVEPFDKPKEIKEFYTTRLDKQLPELFDNSIQLENGTWVKPLTHAPRNYCYIEV